MRVICTICEDDKDDWVRIKCKHTFHKECLTDWKANCEAKQEKATCPKCRLDFSRLQDIFLETASQSDPEPPDPVTAPPAADEKSETAEEKAAEEAVKVTPTTPGQGDEVALLQEAKIRNLEEQLGREMAIRLDAEEKLAHEKRERTKVEAQLTTTEASKRKYKDHYKEISSILPEYTRLQSSENDLKGRLQTLKSEKNDLQTQVQKRDDATKKLQERIGEKSRQAAQAKKHEKQTLVANEELNNIVETTTKEMSLLEAKLGKTKRLLAEERNKNEALKKRNTKLSLSQSAKKPPPPAARLKIPPPKMNKSFSFGPRAATQSPFSKPAPRFQGQKRKFGLTQVQVPAGGFGMEDEEEDDASSEEYGSVTQPSFTRTSAKRQRRPSLATWRSGKGLGDALGL